jgi:hypothetical protein
MSSVLGLAELMLVLLGALVWGLVELRSIRRKPKNPAPPPNRTDDP